MAIPRMTSYFSTAGVVPMPGGGGGEDVPVPPSTTVRPDPSRNKEYVSIDKGAFRTTATLKCPCLVDGQPLWGWVTRSFTNAFEGDNSLSCPTQTTRCDRLLPGPPRCATTNHTARASEYDRFTTE